MFQRGVFALLPYDGVKFDFNAVSLVLWYMPTVAAQHDTGKAEEEGGDHRRTERGVECPGQLLHAAE